MCELAREHPVTFWTEHLNCIPVLIIYKWYFYCHFTSLLFFCHFLEFAPRDVDGQVQFY